ncbi:MAG TPA: PEP-CTERM sorting domain-containing protein [Candidatus Saccharimonadales bacterium]|nr:PEP-CTERM sorting domain-containing protein [Candidatus Saccharimonadales bacterium]
MKRVATILLAVAALTALGTAGASAVPLTLGSGWQPFLWNTDGVYDPADGFQVTAPDLFTIKLTDAFVVGDAFDLYDGASLILSTPSVPKTAASFTADPDVAWSMPDYSHGWVTLGAGSHNLSILIRERALDVTGAPWPTGEGYIRADAGTIPEPRPVLLLGLGLAAAGLMLRRRSA